MAKCCEREAPERNYQYIYLEGMIHIDYKTLG